MTETVFQVLRTYDMGTLDEPYAADYLTGIKLLGPDGEVWDSQIAVAGPAAFIAVVRNLSEGAEHGKIELATLNASHQTLERVTQGNGFEKGYLADSYYVTLEGEPHLAGRHPGTFNYIEGDKDNIEKNFAEANAAETAAGSTMPPKKVLTWNQPGEIHRYNTPVPPAMEKLVRSLGSDYYHLSTAPGGNDARKWYPRDGYRFVHSNRKLRHSACFARSLAAQPH